MMINANEFGTLTSIAGKSTLHRANVRGWHRKRQGEPTSSNFDLSVPAALRRSSTLASLDTLERVNKQVLANKAGVGTGAGGTRGQERSMRTGRDTFVSSVR
jgi:hypothetical protein